MLEISCFRFCPDPIFAKSDKSRLFRAPETAVRRLCSSYRRSRGDVAVLCSDALNKPPRKVREEPVALGPNG